MALSRASILTRTSTRAFSTSIALRSRPDSDYSSPPEAPSRVNPLVGERTTPAEILEQDHHRRQAREQVMAQNPLSRGLNPPGSPPPPGRPRRVSILDSLNLDNKDTAPSKDAPSDHPYSATKPVDIASIIASKSFAFAQEIEGVSAVDRHQVRTQAVTGRTVFLRGRTSAMSASSPAGAFRVLNRMVRDQKVKSKFHSQRFHERKGLKRKRLASQRWRARFKIGFKATADRVLELKRQGW